MDRTLVLLFSCGMGAILASVCVDKAVPLCARDILPCMRYWDKCDRDPHTLPSDTRTFTMISLQRVLFLFALVIQTHLPNNTFIWTSFVYR